MASGKVIVAIFAAVCGLAALVMFAGNESINRTLLGKHHQQFDSNTAESWKEFQGFMKKFNKTYSSMDEMQNRFNIFHANYYWIQVENQRNLNVRFAVNHFADLTQEEFKNTYLGYKPDLKRVKNYAPVEDIELADSLDWVDKGAVTDVKDQGQCGSCWAFSAVGSLECAYFQKTGTLTSFSEQQLVDCSGSYGNQGCNGGLMDYAFDYWESHEVNTESEYPYKGTDGTCQASSSGTCKVSSYTDVSPNEAALKTALNGRVISVAVDAEQWSWYSGGIMSSCGTSLDHGVTLVGYGTDGGQDYWRIKNSWNTWWGESGFIRLKRTDSSSSSGTCGVAAAASYPKL